MALCKPTNVITVIILQKYCRNNIYQLPLMGKIVRIRKGFDIGYLSKQLIIVKFIARTRKRSRNVLFVVKYFQ